MFKLLNQFKYLKIDRSLFNLSFIILIKISANEFPRKSVEVSNLINDKFFNEKLK